MSAPTPAVRQRAKWGSLSRALVVEAATRAVAAGGFETLTIRCLAETLGVAPMTLYRHVRGKDDLLGAVVDGMLAPIWRPRTATSDWQAWVIEAAERLRRFLVEQPAALHVYLAHPVVSAAAIERMEAILGVLRGAGLDQAGAESAYGTVHTYTIGFAALQASRLRSAPEHGAGPRERRLAAYTTRRQFIVGLRYLLEGIGRGAVATGPPPEAAPPVTE